MILVPPDGPLDARFLPIGEAPGPEEEKQLRPFVGKSGSILMNGATVGGVSRARMRILNVSPYRLPETEPDSHRLTRRADQIPALQAEVMRCSEARTLLLIGAESAEAVLGLCGPQRDLSDPKRKRKLTPSMFDYHGSTFTRTEALALQAWARENGIPVMDGLPPKVHSVAVTLHPALTLHTRMPRFQLSIQMAIGRAARMSLMDAGPARPPESFFHLMAEPDEVNDYAHTASSLLESPTTVDVETPRNQQKRIILCGLGSANTKILVFPWAPVYADILRWWFGQPGYIVGHNFLYDLRAFAAYGIRPAKLRRILDTMVACARLQPVDDEVRDFPWLSLATCVARHSPGFYFWKEVDRTVTQALFRSTWPGVPRELQDRLYNGVDVYQNSWLWKIVEPTLQREGML